MTTQLRVLLAHISQLTPSSFVRSDLQVLETEFCVTPFRYRGRRDVPALVANVAAHDVIVSWFAWDHAYWGNRAADLFGRASVTIAGGFDVVGIPEIGYGNVLSETNAARTREALARADVVLALSQSTAADATALCGRDDIRVVYPGFDEHAFPLGKEKKGFAVTVGQVTESNLKRKGIGTFIRTAALLPHIPFFVVGKVRDEALASVGVLPANVQLLGELADDALVRLMTESRVYVQVSAHEGFGYALAEAMLCGCVPVVTNRGAIPEVVGDVGYVVPYDNPEKTAIAIRDALDSRDIGVLARNRITRLFPADNRKKALIAAVREAART